MVKQKLAIIGAKDLPATGGASRSIEYLLPLLSEHFDITIYLLQDAGIEISLRSRINVILTPALAGKRLRTLSYYLFSTFHSLLRGNYDLVYVQHLYSGFIIPLLKLRFKTMLTVHGLIPKNDAKWTRLDKFAFNAIERLFSMSPDALTSVSKIHLYYLESISKREVVYIPNCIDTKIIREIKEIHSVQRITFSAARIIPLKGCHIMLEALRILSFKGEVVIIGDYEQIPAYKEQLLGLASGLSVTFKGLFTDQNKLLDEIYKTDLFIFPSLYEGLSNMLLEVAAIGIPIIASDIDENKAVFNSDEVTFFKSTDPSSLSLQITNCSANLSAIILKAKRAQQKILSEFTASVVGAKYENEFRRLINRGKN